jgi:putative ABC transport system substrate-binding protein
MQFDELKRREFITLLGGAAGWPLVARAQQPTGTRRIGVLMSYPESDNEYQGYVAAFREQLRQLGWTEGRNIQVGTRLGSARCGIEATIREGTRRSPT